MLVTIEQLQTFSRVYNDNTSLADIYIGSATQIINDYVGFDVLTREEWKKEIEHEHIVYSDDGISFYEDEEKTIPAIIPEEVTPSLVEGDKYHYFTYTEEVVQPDIFKLVCLEIATLIQAEEGSNIGVNTQNDVGIQRTFLNVVDYSKYLARLSAYRVTQGM